MGKLKFAKISEMTNGTTKCSAILDSWVLVEHIWDTFDLVMFKVILGCFW